MWVVRVPESAKIGNDKIYWRSNRSYFLRIEEHEIEESKDPMNEHHNGHRPR